MKIYEMLCHRGLGWGGAAGAAAAAEAAEEGEFTFLLGIWIPFIGFRKNSAWTYYLTLGTSLRKKFFSKICDAFYFFNVFSITSIRLIGSIQNLA